MRMVQVDEVELEQVWSERDPSIRAGDAYPLCFGRGADSSAVVVFELEPGRRLGCHAHSAEEVVFVVRGEVELTLGDETERAGAGTLAVIPDGGAHDVRNVGREPARVLGFFSSASVVTVYEHELMPSGQRLQGTPNPDADAVLGDG